MNNHVKKNVVMNTQTGVTVNVTGDLTFSVPTTITLSSTEFKNPGIYTLFTYTGTLTGYSNLTIIPPSNFVIRKLLNENNSIKVAIGPAMRG